MPTEFLPRARSSSDSHVPVPGGFTVRGWSAGTDGLDGEPAKFQDPGAGGMALSCNGVRQPWRDDAAFVRAVTESDVSSAVAVTVVRAV